tara:strand:+ start:19 stop:858 length:840 start_codon:yes stop_codon:yes gene_type:complete
MSGGGGSGSDKGGGGGGPPSVMNPPSKPSKDIPDRNRGQQYTSPKPKPKSKPTVTTGGGGGRDVIPVSKPKPKPKVVTKPTTKGGGTPKVDVGFQEALRKQKIRQQDPVYGDPDPEVDVDPRDRDSITSFLDNYKANIKANPLQAGLLGALATAYQTTQARSMLKGTPGYEFLDNSRGGQNQSTTLLGGGADRDANLQKLVSQSSYAKAGIKPIESVAAKWYNNLGNIKNNFAYQSAYTSAKAKQQGILGSPSPFRYLAINESPFYNWLKDNSLDKGIL